MKGIFNKMLVAALLVSVVPGMYAMDEVSSSWAIVPYSANEFRSSNAAASHAQTNFSESAKAMAGSAWIYVKDHKYVIGCLAFDMMIRRNNSLVSHFLKTSNLIAQAKHSALKLSIHLAIASFAYKAASRGVNYFAPTVSCYYSETIAPTLNSCCSGVSSFFGSIKDKAGNAYDYFKKPVVRVNEDRDMDSVHGDDSIDVAVVTPSTKPAQQRSRNVFPVPTRPLPSTPVSVVNKMAKKNKIDIDLKFK